ncbi:MAG: branched-chain amino acid transaminase [Cystobacter sp.]
MADLAEREGFIWMDGKLIPWRESRLHVLSHGLHYGTSVFEGVRAYGGRLFKLTAHSRRLVRSAELMSFPLPYDVETLDRATEEVVRANGIQDGYVRPIAWLGSEDIGLAAPDARVHVAIAAWSWPAVFGQDAQAQGIRVRTTRWTRMHPSMLPVKAKTAGVYATGVLARRESAQAGFDDVLILDHQGFVAEASGANLFLVERGRLVTPLADSFLDGITRAVVIELARERGLEVSEERVSLGRLREADEVFLTGTAYEVQPVRAIDDRVYPVGEVSRRLVGAYQARVRGERAAHVP